MEIVPPVPNCGSSDARNAEYLQSYTPKKFFGTLVATEEPVIFDVGAHRGESVAFFTSIFPRATVYSFEPEPDNFVALQRVSAPLNCHAFNLAIGEQDARAAYYRHDVSHLGGCCPSRPIRVIRSVTRRGQRTKSLKLTRGRSTRSVATTR
jgi:hypothetical protein